MNIFYLYIVYLYSVECYTEKGLLDCYKLDTMALPGPVN